MRAIELSLVQSFVNENINDFHERRIRSLEELTLGPLLTKNPYLFKAKNILTAGELIVGLLDAFLSLSEEKMFGDFLEGLAIFVAQNTCDGHKSSAPGVDLEFINRDVHFVVSVKSGPRWGNSSQQGKLEADLKTAVARIKQSRQRLNVQAVLGICYGKTKSSYVRGYLKVVGQNFWYLISENMNLYTDIVVPLGYRAKEHNDRFLHEKGKAINRLSQQFMELFCDPSGAIDWVRFVKNNSGNFDLDKFLPSSD